MNEIVRYDAATNYAAAPMGARQEYIRTLAAAGALLPKAAQAPDFEVQYAQTFYIAEVGAMMGIHPLEALAGIHMIDGRWTISSALMSSLVRQAKHKLRVTEDGSWKARDYVATCTIVRHDDPDHPTVMTFGYEDAEMAGLLSKTNWQKYGKSMCVARAISKCARAAAEDALGGARYTPEELDAEVNEEGEPVNVQHFEATPSAPPAAAQPQRAPAPAPKAERAPEPPAAPSPGLPTAAEIPDDKVIDSVPDVAVTLARTAGKSLLSLDVDALAGAYESAQHAQVLRAPGLVFDDLGRPALWGRDEHGVPMPLGAMMRSFKVEILAGLAKAQDAAAEEPDSPEPAVSAYASDDGEPVDAQEVTDEAGGDDSAA